MLVPAWGFGPHWMTPLVGTQTEVDLLAKVRTGNPFPFGERARPGYRFPVAELHETNDRQLWASSVDSDSGRSLWKGESFYQYDPHGEEARWCPTSDTVWKKVRKPRPGAQSRVTQFVSLADRRQSILLELDRARVAYRQVGQ